MSSTTPRLPPYFPRAPAECKAPAEEFFACFSAAAVKKDDLDTEAGVEGLKACTRQLAAYDKCMQKSAVQEKTQNRLFRVQEEYRTTSQTNKK